MKREGNNSQRSILFINNNLTIFNQFKLFIRSNIYCYFAKTGESALLLFYAKQPDLVVCNINLPDISGLNLCKEMKKANQSLCFILLSAQYDRKSIIKGLENKADTFIDRSLSHYEIFLRIRNLNPDLFIDNSDSLYLQLENKEAPINKKILSVKTRLYRAFDENYSNTHTPSQAINIAIIAKELALSVRSLQRKLKQETGLGFSQHHLIFRLEKAKLQLQQGASSNEIAKKLGFSSSAYFASCFKKKLGITPSEYKRGGSVVR